MAQSPPERKGILELLDQGPTLEIPPFQRSFSWERVQVEEYWRDLKRALDASGGPEDYFLGLLVLDDASHIEDGQQRLATTLLLASQLHERAEAAKKAGDHDASLATDVAAKVTPALRSSPNEALRISLKDQDALLRRTGIRSDAPESTKRLAVARTRLGQLLEEDLAPRSTPDAKLARLNQWGQFLRSKAYVVVLQVPPRNAHNIFETLNTRGVRLSNGDLVKSHLIARATDTPRAVTKWNQVTEELRDTAGKFEADLESFLLHYYGSRYDRTTKAKFFADYRSRTEGADALTLLDELIESAKIYHALVDPLSTSSYWSKVGEGAQEAIELINGLGLRQLRYLLLAVLRDLATNDSVKRRRTKQRDAVIKISAWSVRGHVLGRTGGGEAERTYISAASQIRTGGITTVAALRKWFDARDMLVADDTVFKREFKRFAFDRPTVHTRARAILRALEYAKIPKKAGLQPRGELTVEHVLPKSPAPGQWTDFSEDERRAYTHRLGNLLLVDGPSGANDQLANKEWPDKKRLIKEWGHQTPLTTDALTRAKWNTQTIDARDDALASLATKTFKV